LATRLSASCAPPARGVSRRRREARLGSGSTPIRPQSEPPCPRQSVARSQGELRLQELRAHVHRPQRDRLPSAAQFALSVRPPGPQAAHHPGAAFRFGFLPLTRFRLRFAALGCQTPFARVASFSSVAATLPHDTRFAFEVFVFPSGSSARMAAASSSKNSA
jgi:hypothetical protein